MGQDRNHTSPAQRAPRGERTGLNMRMGHVPGDLTPRGALWAGLDEFRLIPTADAVGYFLSPLRG